MRNFFIFLTFFMFIVRKEQVIIGASTALSVWAKSIFPILFPTFIVADLLQTNQLLFKICYKLGVIFKKLFKTSSYALYIFVISMFCGTPTNAKCLKNLYDKGLIEEKTISKILTFTFFFNPFFVLSFTNIKVLLILWISNILTGIILRNKYSSVYDVKDIPRAKFNLNASITNNLQIVINILGTIAVFMIISYAIPFVNPLVNALATSFLEVSTALFKINMYYNYDYFYLIALSLGGLSIIMQIKSIMKDTFIDYKLIMISRILTLVISLIICFLT